MFLFINCECLCRSYSLYYYFFFNDTATTEIYTYLHTLSLHDALPICTGADKSLAGAMGALCLLLRLLLLDVPDAREAGRAADRRSGTRFRQGFGLSDEAAEAAAAHPGEYLIRCRSNAPFRLFRRARSRYTRGGCSVSGTLRCRPCWCWCS